MNLAAIAALLEQLIPAGIQLYEQLVQNNATNGQTTAQMLAKADADWDTVSANAKARLTPPIS
jgi:hypothetical protein